MFIGALGTAKFSSTHYHILIISRVYGTHSDSIHLRLSSRGRLTQVVEYLQPPISHRFIFNWAKA